MDWPVPPVPKIFLRLEIPWVLTNLLGEVGWIWQNSYGSINLSQQGYGINPLRATSAHAKPAHWTLN